MTTTTARLRCGYCREQATVWIDWKTIGRPKGAPVCDAHAVERDHPNNFNERPAYRQLG